MLDALVLFNQKLFVLFIYELLPYFVDNYVVEAVLGILKCFF